VGRFNGNALIGAELKQAVQEPGPWVLNLSSFGEILPNHLNYATLDRSRKDKYGLPVLKIDTQLRENERAMQKEMVADAVAMFEAAGYKDIYIGEDNYAMGLSIHEAGAARMGSDPRKSVLNKFNQVHACQNVFVTDGSFMASSACQNPSLTYMAFTARAASHAVEELKRGNL
jgi:choline dehydrogenase-like flavoprotein